MAEEEFTEYVYDMNSQIGDWPRAKKEWKHSDIKKVALPYVFSVFVKMVEKGVKQ